MSDDLGVVRRSLSGMTAFGRTSLFDALYAALSLRHAADMRSMVLLFSDGADNSSWLNARQLRQVGRQCDSVVYAVGLDATIREQLKELIDDTGGTVVIADSPTHLRPLLVTLLAEMQSRYLLTYYPRNLSCRTAQVVGTPTIASIRPPAAR